jgi:hypothetical protein
MELVRTAAAANKVRESIPAPPVVSQAAGIFRSSACWISSTTFVAFLPEIATPIDPLAMALPPNRIQMNSILIPIVFRIL